jgi:hypothetical protein
MGKVICPLCGNPASQAQTRYGLRSECCDLWSWDGKPLASAEMHEARMAAHVAFDPLWKSGKRSRAQAYNLLAEAMNMKPKDCHMATMSLEDLRRVPEAVKNITFLPPAAAALLREFLS